MTFHAVSVPSVDSTQRNCYARENEVIKCDYKQRGGFNAISTHTFLLFYHFFAMRFPLLSIIILLCDFNDFLLPQQKESHKNAFLRQLTTTTTTKVGGVSGQQQRQQLAVKMYKKMFLLCLFNGFYGLSFLASLTDSLDNVNKQIKRTFF